VNAFFSAAFGISLEGLILVSYITVIAGGASDETLGLLARGDIPLFGNGCSARPAALIMALPIIFTTYSAFYLLIGLIVMISQGPGTLDVQSQTNAFRLVSLIPIGFGFICMCSVFVVGELGTQYEFKKRREQQAQSHTLNRSQVEWAHSATITAVAMPPDGVRWPTTERNHVGEMIASGGYHTAVAIP
jgi:hypothetical protein